MKSNFIKSIVANKINLLGFFIALFCSYLLFPNYFESDINPLKLSQPQWMSIDPSWAIELSYAKIKDLTWGKDIVFTYGPLSHLCTRAGWGENKFSFLLFDLFMFVNFFMIFFLSFKKSSNKIITVIVIIFTCILYPFWSGIANPLILMLFLLFWIRMSLDDPKPLFYFFQIAIVTLVFFIKFNTGLIAFPLFYAGIFYNLISKKENRLYLIFYSILPIIFLFLFSSLLNVSLFAYMKSGFELVKGYNEVMFSSNSFKNSLLYSRGIIFLLFIVICFNIKLLTKQNWLKKTIILFLFFLPVLVLYKQSFVRADSGHVFDFFIFSPLLILCNTDLHFTINKKIVIPLLLLALIIPFQFLFIEQEREIDVKSKFMKPEYIKGFNKFTPTSGMHLFPNELQLPSTVLQKIQNKTIDIFPWNIQLLLQNKLNYHPRPVIQSYTAYTPYLENLNFEHFNSFNNAPEFVIYEIASTDNRYPIFDESKVSVALMKNYEVAEIYEFDGRKGVLLQKKTNFKPIKFEKVHEYAMMLNSPLVPKKDIYYEVGIYNNILGKLTSIYSNAPEIQLEIKTNTRNLMAFRTSKPLLETGVFYDKFIYETKDFCSIFDPSIKVEDIKYYNFTPINPSLFKDKIRITEYKIKQ